MRPRPTREHVEALMARWREQMGVKRAQPQKLPPVKLAPKTWEPTPPETDEAGLTPQMRAWLEKRDG